MRNILKSPGVCGYEVGLGYLCNQIQDLSPSTGESTFVPLSDCFLTSNNVQLYVNQGMFCPADLETYTPLYRYPVPNTAPVITILGDNPTEIYQNTTYTDLGATAQDQEDGNLTLSIITLNQVNTSIVGDYTVKYTVQDLNDLVSTVERTVQVKLDDPD